MGYNSGITTMGGRAGGGARGAAGGGAGMRASSLKVGDNLVYTNKEGSRNVYVENIKQTQSGINIKFHEKDSARQWWASYKPGDKVPVKNV